MCIRDRMGTPSSLPFLQGVGIDSPSTAFSSLKRLGQQGYVIRNEGYEPVSYTHLDVYKRQVHNVRTALESAAVKVATNSSSASFCVFIFSSCPFVEHAPSRKPVSYTHLVNRLSDYLFVLSRKMNQDDKKGEIFWNNSCK